MKKYIWIFVLFCSISNVFAQQSSISWKNIDNNTITKSVTQDLYSDNITDLNNIQSMFCNDSKITKDLTIDLRPWQRKNICIVFINKSNISIPLSFWFSDTIVNNEGLLTCDVTKNTFSKSIKNNIITWIIIPVSWTIIQNFTYISSKNTSWNINGCFGYQIDKQEKIKDGNMFLIIPRKVWFIYINITWSVYNFWRRDDIKESKNTIFKFIAGVLSVWIIITIFQKDKKKDKR